MTSSVPQSATLPPPLHSPHSPFTKNRVSAFGNCCNDGDELCHRRPQQPQLRLRSDADRLDVDASSFARVSLHSSQPTTPCTETHASAFVRGVKSNTSTPALDTPPSLGKSKDARLACRQTIEDAYAPTVAEVGGDSGRPQKKELRLEERIANVCTVNRAVFTPASALSATTTASMDAACTGGRDSSIFSFTSSVQDAYLASLPLGRGGGGAVGANRRHISSLLTSPQSSASPCPALHISGPAAPTGNITTVVDSSGERAACCAAGSDASASSSRISKCKQRLQGLNRPAFDLKAVEEAQPSFLEEEEVCNAAQCFPLSEITPLLWVGTWKDAANPALLRRLGIKYVLNVARELDPAAEANVIARNKDIVYESIPMSDCHSQDVAAHLRQAFQFIERARAAKSRVLVHCRRGISRSPAIVVGYLMASEHRSYEEALQLVTERRSCVSLNLAFQERLSEYVPNTEFYHGPPSSPAATGVVPSSSSSVDAPSALLPSLQAMSSRSEHSCGGACGGGGAEGRGTSNASSRASSTMRQELALTAAPSPTLNFHRAPHRPRLALHKSKKLNSTATFTTATTTTTDSTTPTTNSTSTATTTATTPFAADSSVLAATPVTGRQDKSSWLEEEVASCFVAPVRHSRPVSNGQRAESMCLERDAQLRVLAKSATQPTGCRGGFLGTCAHRSFGNSDNDADTNKEEEEEEIEEPGSPFGVGNRRAFSHFNFGLPSDSSTNVSPRSKKNARSFADEVEHTPVLSHSRSSSAVCRGADGAKRLLTPSWDEDEEAEPHRRRNGDEGRGERRFSRLPHRGAPPASAFDDAAADDDGDGEADDEEERRPSATADFDGLPNTRFTLYPGRLSPFTKAAGSAPLDDHSSTANADDHSKAQSSLPMPLRALAVSAKASPNAQAESPSRGEDSSSSVSHGNTTGTVGGFSATPYGTQGSLNDEPNLSGARVVSHTSSLSG
ncbi:dual specificity phosphatase-like protein [Leptomonas pyrrhocoris]|uniref:protein-tyrosine-phosphatase n=1 Tax=Leptomonas pyrrhocoris TaxID=157538 RepID=A0A0N0VFD5_LEPPY|nr:dual specificity phosphatase-like protein [Leptomonas pyrrhocoris]KPA80771.1 dual specificity phosphatase-like protein [Leptomonas pyrrhocoris]|eukprot:XP_015659210.1 dual specificity phosphatase-like protein [Leptomonas pyrrhocoris]